MKPDLSNIIESFNKLNDQARYGILAGVAVFVILLDVFLGIMPQMGAISQIDDQINQTTVQIQQEMDDRLKVNLIKKNLEKTRVQLSQLSIKVRPAQEVPSILETISNVANDNGVKIDQLAPDKAHQESLDSSSENKYYALPVVIKARCGYHMFGRFLNKLEDENIYFIVKDFIVQNDGKDPRMHLFTLTIKIILVDKA